MYISEDDIHNNIVDDLHNLTYHVKYTKPKSTQENKSYRFLHTR